MSRPILSFCLCFWVQCSKESGRDIFSTICHCLCSEGSRAALEKRHFFNDLSLSLFGRFKGGAGKAAVVSSGLTGLVSGSSIANVVTTGTFTIPLMKKAGYPAKIAAATEVAASTNGQLMPPIMGAAAFIIAEYLGIDYLEVVKAAAIPAFVSYFALFYIAHLEA
ncbi:MAG: TRAP transporter large permease subunit, partial [Planctomycetota bacterium]